MKNNLIKNMLWSLVFVLSGAGICSAQGTLYFPQFVDGTDPNIAGNYWGTIIEVTNPTELTSSVVSGSITLKKDSGTVMDITLTDENGQPQPTDNSFQLSAGQTKFFFSPKVTSTAVVPYNVGYATVSSNLAIAVNLIFLEGKGNVPFALAGVPASPALNRQVIFANANTGVAVLNPFSNLLTLTFQYFDKSGALIVPAVTRTLAPNSHTAFFVGLDLFPTAPSTAVGTLRMTSTNSFVATALLFQNIQTNGPFGTIPVSAFQ
jgi:hypothetical protein